MNGSRSDANHKVRQAEQARLGRFFETINKHREALDLAIEDNFEGG